MSTATYNPLASQKAPLVGFLVMSVLALAVVVGFGVVALVAAHPDPRDGRASIALGVLMLIAAYLYLVRIAYRLDLYDGYLEVRAVLRRRRVDVDDVQEIRRTRGFAIIKVRGRHRLQVWGGSGLQEFVDAVRVQAPHVTGPEPAAGA